MCPTFHLSDAKENPCACSIHPLLKVYRLRACELWQGNLYLMSNYIALKTLLSPSPACARFGDISVCCSRLLFPFDRHSYDRQTKRKSFSGGPSGKFSLDAPRHEVKHASVSCTSRMEASAKSMGTVST